MNATTRAEPAQNNTRGTRAKRRRAEPARTINTSSIRSNNSSSSRSRSSSSSNSSSSSSTSSSSSSSCRCSSSSSSSSSSNSGMSAFSRSCLRLSPIVSPQYAFVLDGVSAFARSCLPLSSSIVPLLEWCARLFKVLPPLVPHCSPFSPIVSPHVCTCVGWCVRLPDVLFPNCLPLSPHVCLSWIVCPPSEVLSPLVSLLVYPCLRLSPRASHCLPLPAIVSHCLPTCACVGWSTFPKCWF